MDLPEGLAAFESFLMAKGLSCKRRGKVPTSAETLVLYDNNRVGVRVLSDRGVWFAEVSDIAGSPGEWYDAAILRDLLRGRGEDVLSISEQMGVIEKNWSAIVEAFAPNNMEDTHERLRLLRNERAKRMFPEFFGREVT